MVSIKDIAKAVGASPSTVSFVLNGKEKEMRISEALSVKIRKAAKDAGYQRNQVAVSLRTGKSNIIALIVDTISGSFFSSLAKTIEVEAQRFGYRVIYCSTGNHTEGSGDLLRLLNQYHVDGYLVIPSEGMENDLQQLKEKGKPVILMDSYFHDMNVSYVMVNNYSGVSMGVNHLISKGHKKIGFVCNGINMVQMKDRKRGFTETMKQHKLPAPARMVCETAYEDAKETVVAQIAAFIKKEQPDAVMFAANYLGVYGLEAIKSLNLAIPADIGMACFDDLDLFGLYPPGITSIRQPIEEIAKTAMHLLMDEMTPGTRTKMVQLQLEPKLIERNSA